MPHGTLSRWVLRSAAHCTVPEHAHHLTPNLVIRRCRNPPCHRVCPTSWYCPIVFIATYGDYGRASRWCLMPGTSRRISQRVSAPICLLTRDSSLVPEDHGEEGRFVSCGEDLGDVDGRRERLVQTFARQTALSTNVCGRGCLATVVEEGRPQSERASLKKGAQNSISAGEGFESMSSLWLR